MNNEERKKNIVDILQLKLQECPLQPHGIMYRDAAEYIADALIAAGIGDVKGIKNEAIAAKLVAQTSASAALEWVKEWKHRALVAERALDKATELAYTYRTQDDTLSCSSCPFFDSIFDRCKEQGLYEDCSKRWKEELLRQAEKELAGVEK